MQKEGFLKIKNPIERMKGVEPSSPAWKAGVMSRYTTSARLGLYRINIYNFYTKIHLQCQYHDKRIRRFDTVRLFPQQYLQ